MSDYADDAQTNRSRSINGGPAESGGTGATQVELRRGNAADLEQLLPLVKAYHEFEGIDGDDNERRQALGFLLGAQEFGALWLIHADRRLAGYIALCKGYSIEFGGFDAFVDEFYLGPDYRGRGIGRQVLRQIVVEARTLGIRALHLEVARDNDRARKLYRGAGFEAREKYLLMTLDVER